MSSTSLIAILVAFAAYLLFMIVIGVWSMNKTKSTEDYFLGGRGLSGWVAALSAQASDMSGWLLMGLPGSIYALGTGQAWRAVGLFLGTVCNWLLISKRLRRYTIIANNSMTLPEFFENRFHDKKKILLTISSGVIVIFFLVYTASALASGGKLFNTVFGVDYHIALAIGAAVILTYTFLGGFLAVCTTDFIQGLLMLMGLLIVPIVAYAFIGGDFYNNIVNVGRMKYIEYNFRSYGQPKLDKPKELKGVKTIGSVDFIAKHCKPQIFIKDNDVWIKHTDYFSPEWRPPAGERIDMPTNYYLKKYFGKTKSEKFIYSDCWGSIILRNEAWIKLENLIPLCKYREMNYSQIASDILSQQKFSVKGMSDEVCLEWERYWQNVVKYVCEYIGVKR